MHQEQSKEARRKSEILKNYNVYNTIKHKPVFINQTGENTTNPIINSHTLNIAKIKHELYKTLVFSIASIALLIILTQTYSKWSNFITRYLSL